MARLGEALGNGVRDPEFEELVHRIDSGPLHGGNEVTLFFNGEKAFASLAEAIESARQEILLETYILKDDVVGCDLIERLGRAAARGVRVRVLADAFGSWTTRASFWRQLRRTGIEARLFHPFWVHIWDHLVRDHRKIVVVDGRLSFTGGMNIGNEYASARNAKGGMLRDTHARIEGPTAGEMALVFKEGWMRSGGESFSIHPFEWDREGGIKTLVLDSRPGRGHAETAAVLAAVAGASRRRLWITNSYFAPRYNAIYVLGRAAQRGVDVRLLVPGVTDVPIVRHAGHGYFAELLASGVRIFEYQPAILHAKTLVADDYVSVIGSSNLDFRSFHFNAECNVLVLDDETARQMSCAFEADLAQSVEIVPEQWKKRPLLHRTGDSLARFLSPLL